MPSLLLIDTDPSFTYLLERYCQMCGCTLTSVRTREDAVHVAKSSAEGKRPLLIVIHLTPPPQGAFALVQSLKKEPATAHISILLCGTSNDAAGAWEAGADHWLSKPVMLDDFRAVLRAAGLPLQSTLDS
jgi:DNA-binding response OmpR family regulator